MSATQPPADRRALLKEAVDAIEQMQRKLDDAERRRSEPIAIIGIGCRVPGGASTPEEFWALMRDGVDAVRPAPADRWGSSGYAGLGQPSAASEPSYSGGFLDQIDRFDARFFGVSPREATALDPQHRLLLEVCWEALEHAGQAPDRLAESPTGVYIGISSWEYCEVVAGSKQRFDFHASTGVVHNTAAGRVSYVLGLRGPCLAVDTACSSSLVAVHLACESLRRGESRLALAGGVNVLVRPDGFAILINAGALAPDWRCKTFDEAADGFVRAEGSGIVVLKRLSDALADRDNVLAVIRGSAINHDGASSGLTVPNGVAQQQVLRQALAAARVAPADVSYVEAHGTGTSLGDPIELEALATVLGEGRRAEQPLMVGSVKTNIGHLEAAAGVVGLIKVVLSLQHGEIPAHLHFKTLTSRASLGGVPVTVPTERTPWRAASEPRIAGISAFGFSGTNAHVIVAEPPATVQTSGDLERPAHLLVLSAKSEAALTELAGRYQRYLAEDRVELGDVCFTAATGRAQLAHRLAIPLRSREDAQEALARVAAGQSSPRAHRARIRSSKPRVAFLFTGQGAQYAGMGRELYRSNETFRRALDRCDAALRSSLPLPLLSVIYPEPGQSSPLDETQYTQPALFALEYALTETWREWGILPSVVLGHSVGEYVAACVAGLLDLEDALALIATRGRLMQALPPGGAMAAVFASEAEVAEALRGFGDRLAIAAVNAPDNVVVSGAADALGTVVDALGRRGVRTQTLTVSHAFHSPLMDPMLDEFAAATRRVRFGNLRVGLVSNLTGRLATAEEMSNPDYWRRHVRWPVRFATGMATLREQGIELFIEMGPAPTLLGLGRRNLGEEGSVWLPSLRKGRDDWDQMLDSLGRLHVEGVEVDWTGFDRSHIRRRVALPAYPFQRERYWAEAAPQAAPASEATDGHPLVGRRVTSPRLRETTFQYTARAEHPAFLEDHKIHGTVVFPGTAYLETMLAAAGTALGESSVELESVAIQAPMLIDAEVGRVVQVIVGPRADGSAPVEVWSRPLNDERSEAWQCHATARAVRQGATRCAHPGDPGTDGRSRCTEPVSASGFYERLAGMGLDYGATFRGVRELWRGADEGLGLVEVDAERLADLGMYRVHPAILDACLHVFAAAGERDDSAQEDIYVPVGLERVQIFHSPGNRIWSLATVTGRRPAEGTLTGDVHLFDDEGRLVACLTGLTLRRMPPEALGRAITTGWLHEVVWRPQVLPVPPSGAEIAAPGQWLILSDRGGVGASLAARLEAQGHHCEVVFSDDVDVSSADGVTRWWRQREPVAGPVGVVHLWSLDAPPLDAGPDDTLERATRLGVGSLLQLAQAITAHPAAVGKLTVVTRGAQRAGGESAVEPSQAPTWGLVRVVRSEHPSLAIACVDLDPDPSADEIALLAVEALSKDREDEVAFRAGERRVSRLVSRSAVTQPASSAEPAADAAVRLEIPTRGTLENLRWVPVKRTPPGPGQVEIEVRASGLNFRDVLNALGMYPGDPGALGNECAGYVSAVGEGVEDLQIGDAVLAIAGGAFSTYAIAEAGLVARKPAAMTMADAAGIPVTFLTAAYALHTLARIQAGERVLIHAGAGGVGLAALQVAQRAGAEVFATAGSPAKREYLARLGVRHVMDSRSLRFSDEVMAATNGEGIDVVLNSLSGDFISESLRLLRAGGRFIEIGKRGVWDQPRVAAAYPGVSYHVFYLGEACAEDPAFVGSMLRGIVDDIAVGALHPLPQRTFAADAAADAFRFMAQARHIGKVVIAPPVASRQTLAIRADATYLVTGGLGALGLQVARWLHEEGARHLVLMGRSEPREEALEAIRELEQEGCRVEVVRGDVSCPTDVSRVLERVGQTLPPLRGIVHAAGVLDDGILAQQTWDRLVRVMAPKVAGAVNLQRLVDGTPLDFFVLFSSASALLGSPGQANYVAANAFLDALAHHRHLRGLPAVSINWGPWSGGGMAAATRRSKGHVDAVRWIAPERGRALLGRVVREPAAQLGVLSVDWRSLATTASAQIGRPFFSELLHAGDTAQPADASPPGHLRAQLVTVPTGERLPLMLAALRRHLSAVLRLSAESLDADESLGHLGIDSLMAVELKNRLERDLAVSTPVADLLQASTLGVLAATLCGRLGGGMAETPTAIMASSADALSLAPVIEGRGEDARQLLVRLPSLDDAEVARQLSARGLDALEPAQPDGARATLARCLENEARTTMVYPASHGQQALWFLHQVAPESPSYNVALATRLQSAVKAELLQASLQALVDRHPSLRTTLALEGDRVVQRVHGEWPVRMETVDTSKSTADQLRRLVEAAARRPFDLARGPLVRTTLFTGAPDGAVLLVVVHHVAFDAWSLEIFVRELCELYAAAEARRPPRLKPQPYQYTDFAAWQDRMLGSPAGARARGYWQAELGGDLPLLALPTDRPRPSRPRFQGASELFVVDGDLSARVKALAAAEGATLYAVLLAAYHALLRRQTGQDEILIGSPVAGRLQPELSSVIGYFVNTVAIRGTTGGDPSFRRFLHATRDKVLLALEHQEYPFPVLVKELGVNRATGRSPVFQTLFNFIRTGESQTVARLYVPRLQPDDSNAVRSGDLVLEPLTLLQQEGQFDLDLEMFDIGDGLGGRFRYDTDLFESATVARLARIFVALLEVIVADPGQPVSAIVGHQELRAAESAGGGREEVEL